MALRRVTLTALLVAGLGILALPAVPVTRAAEPDPLLNQRTKGNVKAPLIAYEMSDFQCPWCRRQAVETFPQIERDYIATGKVRWTFINFPIPSLHPNAVAAARFALCAARQDRFWPIHDRLFSLQDKWAPLKDPGPFLLTLVDSAGLAAQAMTECLQDSTVLTLVRSEAEGAAKSGVSSTPTVYLQGVGLIPGYHPYPVWQRIFDSLLAERRGQ